MQKTVSKEKEDAEIEVEEENRSVTVILIKLPDMTANGYGTRFQLLVPQGYGLNVLRRFVYSGCKAIGIKEYLAIHMEAGKRCFPFDYPETAAGKDWI